MSLRPEQSVSELKPKQGGIQPNTINVITASPGSYIVPLGNAGKETAEKKRKQVKTSPALGEISDVFCAMVMLRYDDNFWAPRMPNRYDVCCSRIMAKRCGLGICRRRGAL